MSRITTVFVSKLFRVQYKPVVVIICRSLFGSRKDKCRATKIQNVSFRPAPVAVRYRPGCSRPSTLSHSSYLIMGQGTGGKKQREGVARTRVHPFTPAITSARRPLTEPFFIHSHQPGAMYSRDARGLGVTGSRHLEGGGVEIFTLSGDWRRLWFVLFRSWLA